MQRAEQAIGERWEVEPGPPLPDRRVLRDARWDAELRERGLVVVDLLGEDDLAALREAILGIYRGERTGQHYTLLSTDMDYRRDVFDTVPRHVDRHAGALFDDYTFCASSLAFKWPGDDAVLGAHQDISMVDETRFRSYNLWIPLVDTDERNGAVRYLMGSHRVLDNLRTMPGVPAWFRFGHEEIGLEEFEPVPVKAGQAIVFDHAMLHGSGPNLSDEVRPAVIAAYRPAEAQLLHYFLPDADRPEVEVYDADREFYRNQLVGQRPERPPDRRLYYYGTPRTAEDILASSRRVVPPADLPTGSNPAAKTRGDREQRSTARFGGTEAETTDSRPVGPEVRRTLVDDGLEEHLELHGYAVLDVLEAGDVRRVAEIVEEIYPFERAGFHASNFHTDHEFRRSLDERVGPVLDRALIPSFDRYTLYNVLSTMKFPGEDSGFVVHQDWRLVDERYYRGVNVWCPLVDTDATNGGMLVLPGSHSVLDAVRCGPDFPASYQAPGLQLGWDDLVQVPVRAGQALVFDHRLLHSSGPNTSTAVRPAVVGVMMPSEAELLHWFLPDPAQDRLEVLAIDEEFFCSFSVGERPPYPCVDEVPFVPDQLSPQDVLEACAVRTGVSATAALPSPVEPLPSTPDADTAPEPAGPGRFSRLRATIRRR